MTELVGQGRPFYSAMDMGAKALKRKVGTGSEFLKELMGLPGVKPTELKERGLEHLMNEPKMTHEEFLGHMARKPPPMIKEKVLGNNASEGAIEGMIDHDATEYANDAVGGLNRRNADEWNEVYSDFLNRAHNLHYGRYREEADKLVREGKISPQAAHEDYTLPGGENYREMLIKAPKEMEGFEGNRGHFRGEPNILASMRLKDRTGPNGEKLLHLEELQSDWHQQGREYGYQQNHKELPEGYKITHQTFRGPKTYHVLDAEGNVFASGLSPESATENALENLNRGHGVPDAPFKKNWEEMAIKRLIHHAAEKGYHGIVMTPGQEQADRYSLAKNIDALHYNPDTHRLIGKKNGRLLIDEVAVPLEKLESYIGKETAQKVMSQEPNVNGLRSLLGEDLNVGGEGMKAAYDNRIPNIFNDIGKKYDVKTELNGYTIEKPSANNPNNLTLPGQTARPADVPRYRFYQYRARR